jgi:hypothetical protein
VVGGIFSLFYICVLYVVRVELAHVMPMLVFEILWKMSGVWKCWNTGTFVAFSDASRVSRMAGKIEVAHLL